jgi:hypothetical protein
MVGQRPDRTARRNVPHDDPLGLCHRNLSAVAKLFGSFASSRMMRFKSERGMLACISQGGLGCSVATAIIVLIVWLPRNGFGFEN